jgi:hypothetical protein
VSYVLNINYPFKISKGLKVCIQISLCREHGCVRCCTHFEIFNTQFSSSNEQHWGKRGKNILKIIPHYPSACGCSGTFFPEMMLQRNSIFTIGIGMFLKDSISETQIKWKQQTT